MFLPFLDNLRKTGVPVSLREYLTFLEAMRAGLVTYDVEGFYYLARAAMVKDERHIDRFDRAFAEAFRGLESVSVAQVLEAMDLPADWLEKQAEKFLTPEEKAEIAALGGTSASDAVAAMAAAQAAMEDANGTEVTIGMGTTPRSGHAGLGGDDHPLARAVHCVAGFGASHAVPEESIELTVAVRSCLPAMLPVKSVSAVFGDGLYDWTSEDAVSELPARTWRVFVVKVTPAWGHPVNVVALVLTLSNGVRFRLELGDGNRESPRRGWLAPDERLPPAVNSGCNLGVHSLNLRAAPLKMSLWDQRCAAPEK